MNYKREEFSKSIGRWMKTSTHMSMRKMHLHAKNNGLSFPQMNCLFRMRKHGACQVKEVSCLFEISKPAASQMLDKLVHMDLVARKESKEDRRVKYHDLTEKGNTLINNFFDSVKELKYMLVDSFSENDFETYTNVLNSITDRLEGIPIWDENKKEGGRC